jgi:predicted MPP superfamily phosphohydrolase
MVGIFGVFCVLATAILFIIQTINGKNIVHLTKSPRHNDKVTMLLTGDTGTGEAFQKQVAQLLEYLCQKTSPDAIILLGDNFYPRGVKNTQDVQWQSKFENIYNATCLQRTPFWAVLGNHDSYKNSKAQIEYTHISRRWNMPSFQYSVKYSDIAEFFFLNTNFSHYSYCGIFPCGMDKIHAHAKTSKAIWKIFLGHHPAISVGKYKKSFIRRFSFSKLLCDTSADFYFSGHDNNLQYLEGMPTGFACPIRQIISGGGGAYLYPVVPTHSHTHFAQKTYGAVLAEFNRQTTHLKYYAAEDETLLYEKTIVHEW